MQQFQSATAATQKSDRKIRRLRPWRGAYWMSSGRCSEVYAANPAIRGTSHNIAAVPIM